MRKSSFILLILAALLVLTGGVGGWVTSTTQARVEPPAPAETIDPSQMMKSARDLPAGVFTDYTFVFN